MEHSFFHRLGRFLWVGLVALVVALAIYVSGGRLLAANVVAWQSEILRAINAHGPFVVDAEHVSGQWQSFTPVIVLTGLRLSLPAGSGPPLELSQGRMGVDVLRSLLTRSLQLTHVVLDGLSLHGELSGDGSLRLQGLGEGGGDTGQVRDFLLNVETLGLRNNTLVLTMPGGDVRRLGLDLRLSRDGSNRRAEARLTSTRGADISLLAEGVGDPFNPDLFSGKLYADLRSTDLGAVKDLFSEQSLPLWAGGAVNLQVWLGWDNGTPSLELQLEGQDLLIEPREASWALPVDRLALQAALHFENDQWALSVVDIEVDRKGTSFHLPRLQLDAGASSLRMRAADVDLEQLGILFSTFELVPDTLREISTALHPRGQVTALEWNLDDRNQPGHGWELRANFEALAVNPYHGAPGASSMSGYMQLGSGGGFVLLDSQNLTLAFAGVYEEPLFFEDLFGTVHLEWGPESVRLDSGLLTTRGVEGTAKVLFGLDIPLESDDIGIEMDLLVGLQNAHPTHRVKYVPVVLNPTLRSWLRDSIGDGIIEQGAFLWRGSLRKNTAPLHTVQLAFNVADTYLSYHPDWPQVLVRQGVVLIDNSDVSVWADRAELFASSVEALSVETWLNERNEISLALAGRVSGPAADGFRMLNESPLSGVVGSAFAGWTASGHLDTDVALEMNLSAAEVPPRVDVVTQWRDVDLTVVPGNLRVEGITGDFGYSTSKGFSSRALEGEIWGRHVSATLRHHHRGETGAYDPATSLLDIDLRADIEMADVQRWLRLDLLDFASGQAATEIGIRLIPGEPPLLTVNSDLEGVSLDLPRPWRKNDQETRQLHLQIPLRSGSRPLSLALGEDLGFRLDITEAGVSGGSLGVSVQPPEVLPGVLRVAGHPSLIQGDDWLTFVEKYIVGGEAVPRTQGVAADLVDSRAAVPAQASGEPGSDTAGSPALPLEIDIDAMHTDALVFRDRELKDVRFSLAKERALWRLSVDTSWLRADLELPTNTGRAILDVEYLALDQLPDFDLQGEGKPSQPQWDFPVVNITLGNIYQSGLRLGDLALQLSGQGRVVIAENITGELAGLRLEPGAPGRVVWQLGEGGYTEVQASPRFFDLGETLSYFGYQRIVETTGGHLALDLRWPGTPQAFSLREGYGAMQLEIGPGSFLEASSGAEGALRVVSILNLADIVSRLSLSHMFESGIPFDSVDGELYLHGGTLEVAYIDVKGSSRFQFSGVSDIASQTLGGELVATLPVANNLPWIAALAASLPVAAGVFVVSKVFNKQMNRLSSAVYSIKGTWKDPQVDFDRIFDDTSPPVTEKKPGGGGSLRAGAPLSSARKLPQTGGGVPDPAGSDSP